MSTQKPAAPPEQKKGEVNELRTVSDRNRIIYNYQHRICLKF